jgi:DNA replication protein DnaC
MSEKEKKQIYLLWIFIFANFQSNLNFQKKPKRMMAPISFILKIIFSPFVLPSQDMLNSEQTFVLELLNEKRNVILRGVPGTGKSFVVNKYLQSLSKEEQRNIERGFYNLPTLKPSDTHQVIIETDLTSPIPDEYIQNNNFFIVVLPFRFPEVFL